MNLEINPCKPFNGTMHVQGDKSISHRAVMLGAIAEGITQIDNFLLGEDCINTINCFKNLGINIQINDSKVMVHGKGLNGLAAPKGILYAGNSGTTIRILTGMLSGQRFNTTITGDASLIRRPMDRIIEPLKLMGAKIEAAQDKYAPLNIYASKLQGIEYKGHIASAQVKSCIMMASLYADGSTVYCEPYQSRNHTEKMLSAFGGEVCVRNNSIMVTPVNNLQSQKITVPGDISSAAYYMAATLIVNGSEILIKNIGVNPTRTGIIDVLINMGADIKLYNKRECCGEPTADLYIRNSNLKGIEISGSMIPRLIDEIPVIAVIAGFSSGRTVIKDAGELKVKESDRIHTITTELSRLGIDVRAAKDGLIINGNDGGLLEGGVTLDSHDDHRIAMACCVAALKCKNKTIIKNSQCISVSFPGFIQQIASLSR